MGQNASKNGQSCIMNNGNLLDISILKEVRDKVIFSQHCLSWGGGGGGGRDSDRFGYGRHLPFLRVPFWLENKFLGLFYSL